MIPHVTTTVKANRYAKNHTNVARKFGRNIKTQTTVWTKIKNFPQNFCVKIKNIFNRVITAIKTQSTKLINSIENAFLDFSKKADDKINNISLPYNQYLFKVKIGNYSFGLKKKYKIKNLFK